MIPSEHEATPEGMAAVVEDFLTHCSDLIPAYWNDRLRALSSEATDPAPSICGEPVNSDPGAPCTFPAGHIQHWHQHDGTLMPATDPAPEGDREALTRDERQELHGHVVDCDTADLIETVEDILTERVGRIKSGICWRGDCRQSATMIAPGGWPLCTQHGSERIEPLAEAVKDVCWRATQYGQTEDGDTYAYIVTKGAMHRLIGAAQGAGISASFRAGVQEVLPERATDPPTGETVTEALAEAWEVGYDARGRDIANEGLTETTLTPNPYRQPADPEEGATNENR